jgi:hypothetical protein
VRHTGPTKRTDYGTIIFHWLLAASLVIAIGTGLRIAAESADHAWIIIFDALLPQAAVWTGHLQAAVALVAVAAGYVVYMWRLRLGRRLRLDRVRLRGLAGRPFARWGTINIILYWIFFAAMLSQLLTGGLLYFGYARSIMIRVHWLGMWVIIAYIAAHLYSQWRYGGVVQLLRIFRPAQPVAPPRQFEMADILALLDEQMSRPVAAGAAAQLSPRRVYQINARRQAPATDVAQHGRDPEYRDPEYLARDRLRPRPQPVLAGAPFHKQAPSGTYSFMIACAVAGTVVLIMLKSQWQLIDQLRVYRVSAADVPVIDGETSDPIWRKIPSLYVLTEHGGNFGGAGETTVSIQAVHDGVQAYFLFIWDDPTRSLKQLPLRKTSAGWNLLHDGYESGDEHAYSEDKFSVLLTSFNAVLAGDTTFHAGVAPIAGEPRSASGRGLHYTGGEGIFADVWDWRATSTNVSRHCDNDYFGPPVKATPAQVQGLAPYRGGFAHDPGTADYQDNFTTTSAGSYAEGIVPRRLPKSLSHMNAALGRVDLDPNHGESEHARWYMTDQDSAPYSPGLDQFIPDGTVIPGVIISGKYSGDRAEVICAGQWAAGRWALEVTRRLDAASPYDVPIRSGTFMRVAAFDHTQIRHTRHVRPIRLEVQ